MLYLDVEIEIYKLTINWDFEVTGYSQTRDEAEQRGKI